jgi:hypothetical protein
MRDVLADLMLKFVEALECGDLSFAGEVEPEASTMNMSPPLHRTF